jgi:hypothetical protein
VAPAGNSENDSSSQPDPAKLPRGLRGLYYFSLTVMTVIVVVLTAVGAWAATIWMNNAGARVQPALVALPLVALTAGLFFAMKAVVDRIVFGPLPHTRDSQAELPAVVRAPVSRWRKWLMGIVFVPVGVFGVWLVFSQSILPLLSPAVRKSRMEAAVREVLREQGPQRPLEPFVELTEEPEGRWRGTARIGDTVYRIKASRNGPNVSIQWGN